MTVPIAPIPSEIPKRFWKARDAAIEHVLSKAPLPAALADLQEWLATDGWDDLLAAWIVPAAPKLTTRADCALTSVCRVVAVVNRRSAQSAQLIKLQSAATL